MPYKDPAAKRANDKRYREEKRDARNAHQKELYAQNREDRLVKQSTWYVNNKESRSAYSRNRWRENRQLRLMRYGLTFLDYYILLEQQGYQCPICHGWLYPQKEDVHIDHCHKTGKVRGLLHSKCNRLLGHANDDVTRLGNAITYLNKH